MAYNFSKFQAALSEAKEWLVREYSSIRTGRASLALLDTVKVESYGSYMPVNQLANMSLEDVKTIRISPWDSSLIKTMEKAIIDSNLGVSVAVDDKGMRVIFPELTAERRAMFVKLAKDKLEDARVTVRQERQEVINDIQSQQKQGTMTEDDVHKSKEDAQKLVDACNKELEALFEKKEKEITS